METLDAEINNTSTSIWLQATSEIFAATLLNRSSHFVKYSNMFRDSG